MSGPQTEAGRALLERETPPPPDHADPSEEWVADTWALRNEMEGRILAIEREAVAAFLASPEAAEGLARALCVINQRPTDVDEDWPLYTEEAAAILVAWLRATQDGSPGQERAK